MLSDERYNVLHVLNVLGELARSPQNIADFCVTDDHAAPMGGTVLKVTRTDGRRRHYLICPTLSLGVATVIQLSAIMGKLINIDKATNIIVSQSRALDQKRKWERERNPNAPPPVEVNADDQAKIDAMFGK